MQPRRFKSKIRQKVRKFLSVHSDKKLVFGTTGLLLLQPVYLTGVQIFRLKLFLKKATKRSDLTFRYIWFYAFPHLPLTRKPDGIRMGKGKGKMSCWFSHVHPGVILYEAKNLRHGRSIYFVHQTTFKLGVKTRFISKPGTLVMNPFMHSKSLMIRNLW